MNHKPEQNIHLHIHKVKINVIINVLAFSLPSVRFLHTITLFSFLSNRLFPYPEIYRPIKEEFLFMYTWRITSIGITLSC